MRHDSEAGDGVQAEHLGIRVFALSAGDPGQLADQIAVTLGEHLDPDDELHITHDTLPTGWLHTAGRNGWLGHPAHTKIALEYTALLVLRPRSRESRTGEAD